MPELELLSIDDLLRVTRDLQAFRAEWRKIGLYLGVKETTLKEIEADGKDVYDKMTRLISFWLRNEDNELRNYKTIAQALVEAEEKVKAHQIADRENFSLQMENHLATNARKACSEAEKASTQPRTPPAQHRSSPVTNDVASDKRKRQRHSKTCIIVILRQENTSLAWFFNVLGRRQSEDNGLYRKHVFQSDRFDTVLHVYEYVLQPRPFTPDKFFDEIPRELVDIIVYASPLRPCSSQLPYEDRLEKDNQVLRSIRSKFTAEIWSRIVFVVTSRQANNLTGQSRFQEDRVKAEFATDVKQRQSDLKLALIGKRCYRSITVIPVPEKLPSSRDSSRFYKMPNGNDWFNDVRCKMLDHCNPSKKKTLTDYFHEQQRSHDTPSDSPHRSPHKTAHPLY